MTRRRVTQPISKGKQHLSIKTIEINELRPRMCGRSDAPPQDWCALLWIELNNVLCTGEFNAGDNPAMDRHLIQEVVEILLVASCYKNRDKIPPDGPLDFTM